MIHGTRARRRRDTLRQILVEARKIVLSDGLDGLTVARLARAVGYTPGALYRYFPSKGALLCAVDREILDGWTGVLERLEHPDPLVPLLGTAHALARIAAERREDFALIAATVADPRQLVDDPAEAVHLPATRALLERLALHLARASGEGALSVGDPARRAVTFVFSLVGVLQLQKMARFDPVAFDTGALATGLARDLLVGWGADPAAVAAAHTATEAAVEAALAPLFLEEP